MIQTFNYDFGRYGVCQLDLLPSNEILHHFEKEWNELESPDIRLKEALSEIIGDYEYIIIDCPPESDSLLTNALNVSGDDVGSSAVCATVGARVEIAFGKSFGISLTPEGQFAVSKKEVFKALEEASSKIKGWGTGANLRVGVFVKF